jgi:predicted enzyme related to lactoylglutathione lyase
VSAVFDRSLREATVTTTAFTLNRGQDVMQGVVSLATEETAVFTPVSPLALFTTYTATLTTEIESLTGGTLGSDYEWVFTTGDGNWGAAELIETDNAGPASAPEVAIDSSGDAIAVWRQSDGAQFSIWSNRYTPTGGWETPELLETDNAGNAGRPQVGVDPNGNAVAVWQHFDGANQNLWSNRYTPTGGWETPELLETLAGTSAVPQVAVDPNGNAVAVWSQDDGTRFNIWSNRYTPSGGWETAELLETDNAGDAFSPQVATDPSGNAVAVWDQLDGTRFNLWSSRYTSTGGWGIAERIEADNAGSALRPQVAIDSSGNALAVWSQDDGARLNIWANRYTPTGGWGIAERVETDNAGSAFNPQVAVDPNGNAVTVWSQDDGTRFNIWSNRYTPTGGWGIAELIETDNAGNAARSQVAIGPSGNALVVWEQTDGTRENIWSNRFE